MPLSRLALASILLAALASGPSIALAAKPQAAEGTLVEQVLRKEANGPIDRRSELESLLQRDPDFASARWQAGFVRSGKEWVSFEAAKLSGTDVEKLNEYRRVRGFADETPASQLKLADWCLKHGLRDQERAHLLRVVALTPDGDLAPILLRLGCRRINGLWVTRDELRQWQAWQHATESSLKEWGPRLTRLAQQLGKGPRPHEAARKALLEINDPAAIPALELTLAGRDESEALVLVEVLNQFDGYQGSIALARQAAFSQSPTVRVAANETLKDRKLEDFVPPLIALLSTPVQMQTQSAELFVLFPTLRNRAAPGRPPIWVPIEVCRGALFYSYVLARETDNQFQVARFQRLWTFAGVGYQLGTDATRIRSDQSRAMDDELYLREAQVARYNERTQELNSRIATSLSAVSHRDASSEPDVWWQWWLDYNELDSSSQKRVVRVSEDDFQSTQVVGVNPIDFSIRGVTGSCFVAGTPVWSESGIAPIESVHAGDRVLSKNAETGELSYALVIGTTVREPHPTFNLTIGSESFQATAGHRFWISGGGWLMSKQLETGTPLHTATGTAAVGPVTDAGPAKTYNLVVENTHTYFVGRQAVLTHDVTIPQPTNRIVPGLEK